MPDNMPDRHSLGKTQKQIGAKKYAYYLMAKHMPGEHNAIVMKNLEHIRSSKGLTQKDLAAKANVNQATISKIERGEGNPTLEMINRLAAALECPAADLFELPELQQRAINAIKAIDDPARQEAALVVVEAMASKNPPSK